MPLAARITTFWLRLHTLFQFDHFKDILYLYRVHDNTLNAKAAELKLAQNVARVLARDKKRRQFLQSSFRFFQIGTRFALPDTPNGVPIVVVRYQEAEREIKELTASWSNVLLVAYVDEPVTRIDTKILERFDLIVTPSAEVFRFLASEFKTRVLIMDPARELELFYRLTTYRSFEKQGAAPEQQISCSLYQPRKMKMAVLVHRMDQGGLEEVVASLVKNIDQSRFQVSILIPESDPGKMGQLLQQQGFEVHCFDLKEDQFERHLRKNPVDVVHIHHTTFGFEVLLSLGIPYVFTIHNSYTWFADAENNRMKRLLGACELSAAVSSQVRSFTVERFSLDPRRVRTIPNGLDLSQFPKPVTSARESLGIANDDFVFINLSSYHGVKSHPLMLSAVQELVSTFPTIKLICAGNVADRPYFQRLEQRVLEEGLSRNVYLFDHLDKERVWQLLCSSNCFLMPSLQEGWSMAVMEAMYAGLPLILSDIGSAREIIEDSDIGLIIPNSYQQIVDLQWQDLAKIGNREKPENLKHLVKAMSEIYLERDNWRKRGIRGIEKIIGRYDISKMIEMYQQSYLEAIYAGFKHRVGN
jgi:O-antigen biosynthesis protein